MRYVRISEMADADSPLLNGFADAPPSRLMPIGRLAGPADAKTSPFPSLHPSLFR
jgi:hypothetical protein